MEWQVILVLVLGIPLMLATHVYLWYQIIDGIYAIIKEAREEKGAREKGTRAVAEKHPAKT